MKRITSLLLVLMMTLMMALSLCACGPSSDHYVRYHYLSPQEKENAKWAYEVQQALKNK